MLMSLKLDIVVKLVAPRNMPFVNQMARTLEDYVRIIVFFAYGDAGDENLMNNNLYIIISCVSL